MFHKQLHRWCLKFCLTSLFFLSAGEIFAQASASMPHAPIPFKQDRQGSESMAYQSIAALLLASCAAYGIVFALKRYRDKLGASGKSSRRLRTVEATRLGKTSMLYVVEYNGQELLIAESSQGVQLMMSSPLLLKEESATKDA